MRESMREGGRGPESIEQAGTSDLTRAARPSDGETWIEKPRVSYDEADPATLLGLYHGYDEARVALARVVSRFGVDAPSNEETQRRIWGRSQRAGIATELFHPPSRLEGGLDGINAGAHSAALTAFAAISNQAESLLRELHRRWPALCQDAGGPLPVPQSRWSD